MCVRAMGSAVSKSVKCKQHSQVVCVCVCVCVHVYVCGVDTSVFGYELALSPSSSVLLPTQLLPSPRPSPLHRVGASCPSPLSLEGILFL